VCGIHHKQNGGLEDRLLDALMALGLVSSAIMVALTVSSIVSSIFG
jgi:hypothetical protein